MTQQDDDAGDGTFPPFRLDARSRASTRSSCAFPEIEAEGPPGRRTFLLPQPEQLHFEMPALQAQLERVLARRTLW